METALRTGRCFFVGRASDMDELGWSDLCLRLGAACVFGGGLGLNRFLHHKNIGVRTLGLVSIGSAALVAGVLEHTGPDGATRVLQGIITGIGFIGAGVIVRTESEHTVRGLTTAATVWVAAGIGALCGLGSWRVLTISCVLIAVLLADGGRLEKWCAHRTRDNSKASNDPADAD